MRGMKVLFAAVIVAGVVAGASATNVSREQAAAFQKKLEQILLNSQQKSAAVRETTLTEGEVNSYLRFSAGDQIPTGVTEPTITISGERRLHGRAIVDLDAVRRKNSAGGWFDPRSYLTGRLPVTATGTLDTAQGRGKFTLETATISGVPIPKSFLQELLSYYSRSDDYPNGINMDDPFDLPAEIQRIDVHQGRATIVQ
jgi:hypothetical protein